MANLRKDKNPMPLQDPHERVGNFSEVALGYSAEAAIDEAKRCLNCPGRPCVAGCPVRVQIPEFLREIVAGNFQKAYDIITETNTLPAVCGRVCPQENQCEGVCVRAKNGEPVGIGRLERFAADFALRQAGGEVKKAPRSGHRAAVIGAGPAGLSCAGELLQRGVDVTVFEAFHQPGGVLMYGIPEFRLPKAIVQSEIDKLRAQGAEIRLNSVVGRTHTVDELLAEGYDSVFIGTGAGLPSFMGIPGENLLGVYSANELLTRVNLMRAEDDAHDTPLRRPRAAAVIGGGNVAMDAARVLRRLGAEVTIVYRRGEDEMPARKEEVEHAKEEGVAFRLLAAPIEVLGNDKSQVEGLRCRAMALGEPDASGRRRPVEVPDSDFVLPVDAVIVAIGTSPNPLLRSVTKGLETDRRGCIAVDGNGMTSIPGVFAGGDAVTGAATVILAMGAGRSAAAAMDAYMRETKK